MKPETCHEDHQRADSMLSMRTAFALEVGSTRKAGASQRTWAPAPSFSAPSRDQAFIELLAAFRPHGGLMRGIDLADILVRRGQGDHAGLARMIVAGLVISFEWNHCYWVPAFQLDGYSLVVRSGAGRAIAHLAGVFDGWDAATWFATPNPWLSERAPVDVLEEDENAVANAARIARFVITG